MSERKEVADGEGVAEEFKHCVMVKGGRKHYAPQYVAAGITAVQYIFPVPEPNAVGTLDEHSNGIAFIKFGDYGAEPECQVVANDFSEMVIDSFDYHFCSNFSDDTIVYSKVGAVIVADVKTGNAFYARCGLSMGNHILGIQFLDPQKDLFVIVKSIKEEGGGWKDSLHIATLEGRELVDTDWSIQLGKTLDVSSDVPLYHTWFVHDCMLFVYDYGKMLCTDGSQPVSHPFSEFFNSNTDRFGSIKDCAIHPTLPFSVLIENYVSSSTLHQLTVICWEAKKQKNQIVTFSGILEPLAPLFGLERIALAYQSFSPDGDWYVVGCISAEESKAPFFIAIPVDHERPDFLVVEDLVVLGQVKNMTSQAWTTDPTAYVVSNGELLHKWDLAELPTAHVFVMPDAGGRGKKKSIFKKIGERARQRQG